FALLAVPAAITLGLLFVARRIHPRPEDLEAAAPQGDGRRLPRTFWVYLVAAALVAAGSADFPLIAYHLERAATVPTPWIPVLYAAAMGTSGAGALVFGRLFDRSGIRVLVPLTILAAGYAPLAFLGGPWAAALGASLWGLGMGVHESLVPAAVAPMVPPERRPSAYGLFTAGYGVAWFLGSAAMGALYEVSLPALVGCSVSLQLLAIPFLLRVRIPPR
ncbi:MAG TPA: MFS transporter, partial [Actinomycetota bacterium]|nr:MFS transporter [Actinomycetota bacterium]